MKSISIIIIMAFSTIFSNQVSAQESQNKTTNSSHIVKVTYELKGFKQQCCYGMVNFILEEQPGFIKSEPNIELQQVTVWFDSQKSTEQEIKDAINETPYKIIKTVSPS